jgi:hypothetical protein
LPRLEAVGICIICRYIARYSTSKQLLDTPQVDTPLPYSPNPRSRTSPCRHVCAPTSKSSPLPSTHRLKLPTIRVLYSSLRVLRVIFAYHHPHSLEPSDPKVAHTALQRTPPSAGSLSIQFSYPSPSHQNTDLTGLLTRGVSCSFGGEPIDTWGGKLDPNRFLARLSKMDSHHKKKTVLVSPDVSLTSVVIRQFHLT